MRARDVAGSLALALVSVEAGCLSTSAFECESADDCRDAAVDGRCEPNGFCSFPDDECPSDHRYGDHAGDGLGGMCVPDGDDTTSASDPTTSASASDTSPTDATTTNADETPLTDGPDGSSAVSLEGESSASTSTTSDTTGVEESSSTGADACPTFVDDFEDGVIDPEWTTMSGDFVTEANGELTFALTPELDQVYPGVIQYGFDFASGWVRMRVGQPPGSDAERMYLALSVDPEFTEVVYVMIEGSIVYARYELGGKFVDLGALQFSPEEHAWLQIRGDGDDVVFEVSADAATFAEVVTIPAPFPLLDTTIVVAATNFAELPMATAVSVTDVELCEGA